MYDASKVIAGQTEGALVFSKNKHTGPVQALDFNPFQKNLLASGASESGVPFNRHLEFKAWVKDEVKDVFRKALDREMVKAWVKAWVKAVQNVY